MSDKVYVPNTFPTPNVVVDIVLPKVSASAFIVLMVVTRHTLGWGGDNADKAWQVSIPDLRKLTGLSHQSVIAGTRELLKFKLILVKRSPRNSRMPNQYALNLDLTTGQLVKNFDQSNFFSHKFRPILVKKVDSLKINQGNTIREEPDEPIPLPSVPLSLTPVPEKENRRAAPAVPPDLQPIVSRVIAKMNELAGTAYKPETRTVVNGLVQRLQAGASEADCIDVVEDRWQRWQADEKMRQYFGPETLFREANFEKYINAARMSRSSAKGRLYGGGGFVG